MITNKWILGKYDFDEIQEIRKKVFIEEQNIPEDEEFDEIDYYSLHLLLYMDHKAVATGRIYHDGHTNRIGRIAVLKEYRGKGLGDLLIRLLLYKTFEAGAEEIVISAQCYIADVYRKFGFAATGDEYMEANIPHVTMHLKKEDFKLPSKCGGH